jgi:hypothetical protein
MINKAILTPDNPFLVSTLARLYDKWNVRSFEYDRIGTIRGWVNRYVNGASFADMLTCPESNAYRRWLAYVNSDKHPSHDDIENKTIERVNMIVSIANDGYNEEKWENVPGWFPIRISVDGAGLVYSFDGSHRSAILSCLGKDVPVRIYDIKQPFAGVISGIPVLYQPSSHPCVYGLSVNRKDLIRYEKIRDRMLELGINSVCEIGCAEGEGVAVLGSGGASVVGIENDHPRATLALSLCNTIGRGHVKSALDGSRYQAFVGLSVWHHLAKDKASLDEWVKKTKHADYQFIEMPEQGSKTFHPELINEMKWQWENVGDLILDYIMSQGQYKNMVLVYTDPAYANRKTVLISR